jgi:hypothetical protein
MKVTEEIKTEEPVEEFSKEKADDVFFTLLNGKTLTEEIETSRGKFVVKFPKQKDLMAIDRRVAAMRGGLPAESFDSAANFCLQKIAFLDVVIESGEKWFNNLKKQNQNFTWGDMPDSNFVNEVYSKAWIFRCDVQKQFEHPEAKADNGVNDTKNVPADVGDGVFSGVAATVKRT